jgi:hypothetical protein
MSAFSNSKYGDVRPVQKVTTTRAQTNFKLLERNDGQQSLKPAVNISYQESNSSRTSSLIDNVLFHHSAEIRLERNDVLLQSVIIQEKKKNSNSKDEYIAEYTVLKFKYPNVGSTLKYVKINRTSQDQRVSQDKQSSIAQNANALKEEKSVKSISKLSSSKSKDSIREYIDKNNNIKGQETPKSNAVQSSKSWVSSLYFYDLIVSNIFPFMEVLKKGR